LQTVVQISKKEKPFPHSEVQSFQVGLLGFPKLFRAICYNFRWMKLNTVYSQLTIFAITQTCLLIINTKILTDPNYGTKQNTLLNKLW
jgi:hypothetical protein